MKLKIAIIMFIQTLFNEVYALDCGRYSGQGIVKEKNHSLYFVANEKSKSELNLLPKDILETKLAPFLNRPVSISFSINQNFIGTDGTISDIEKIELRAPNPRMGANDNFVKLISKAECEK